MSTSPTTIVTLDQLVAADVVRHRRRDRREYRVARAAGVLLWLAAILAIAAAIVGSVDPWVQVTVAIMLIIGAAALAVAAYRIGARRLDAAIGRLLGR